MYSGSTVATAVGPATLKRSKRRTLAISVLPSGELELVAPVTISLDAINEKVRKKRNWILRQRRAFSEMNADRSKPRYCSGATHRYLGRQYRIKVSRATKSSVKLVGAFFQIRSLDISEPAIKRLLDQWVREKARLQFEKRIQLWVPWCKRRNLPEPRVCLRNMPKRWGSAQRDGRIFLNPSLVAAPSGCIDYVIAHEVCHLKYPDHGREFFQLLDQNCPNWRKAKQRLEQSD